MKVNITNFERSKNALIEERKRIADQIKVMTESLVKIEMALSAPPIETLMPAMFTAKDVGELAVAKVDASKNAHTGCFLEGMFVQRKLTGQIGVVRVYSDGPLVEVSVPHADGKETRESWRREDTLAAPDQIRHPLVQSSGRGMRSNPTTDQRQWVTGDAREIGKAILKSWKLEGYESASGSAPPSTKKKTPKKPASKKKKSTKSKGFPIRDSILKLLGESPGKGISIGAIKTAFEGKTTPGCISATIGEMKKRKRILVSVQPNGSYLYRLNNDWKPAPAKS